MIDSRVDYQKANSTPARKSLPLQKFVDVFGSVEAFGFKLESFASADIYRTNSGVSVVPCFASAPRSFRVASIPVIACVPTTFLAAPRRCVTWGIMIFRAQFIGPIQWFPKILSDFPWTNHGFIEPLVEGFVK